MTATEWFVSLNGQQQEGRHTVEEIGQMFSANPGAVFLVWKEDMDQWMDPKSLDDFKDALPASPPPPPPQATKRPPAPPSAGPAIRHPRSSSRSGSLGQQAGFFKALFDVKFDTFVTPKIISILYIVFMVLIGIGFILMVISGIGSLISGIRFSRGFMVFMGLIWLILSPILTVVYLAFARMFFEVVIVLFKIKDNTAKIAGK